MFVRFEYSFSNILHLRNSDSSLIRLNKTRSLVSFFSIVLPWTYIGLSFSVVPPIFIIDITYICHHFISLSMLTCSNKNTWKSERSLRYFHEIDGLPKPTDFTFQFYLLKLIFIFDVSKIGIKKYVLNTRNS